MQPTVLDTKTTLHLLSHPFIVRHYDESHTLFSVQREEQGQDFFCGSAVEVPGGFIGK
jgi:hypothetical protein